MGRPRLPADLSPTDLSQIDPAVWPKARGAFTAITAHPRRGAVRLTRDHLGTLPVCYHLTGSLLLAADEPSALLGLRDGAGEPPGLPGLPTLDDLAMPDEGSVARFLGFRFGLDDRTFFRRLRRLPPAHHLVVDPREETVEPYWRFPSVGRLTRRPPDELAVELRERLKTAVEDSLDDREPSRVAVSLSGGLDSTAVAAVAPVGVRAVSWRFSDRSTAGMDEAERVEAVARHLGMPLSWVDGDDCRPLCPGFVDRFVHDSSPYVNPFAALKARLYEAAREGGAEQILVGDGGDALMAVREYWLRDLLRHRRFDALPNLTRTARRALRGDRFAKLSLRRLLPRSPLSGGRAHRSEWLTPEAHALLPPPAPSPIAPRARGAREAARFHLTVGAKHTRLEAEEQRLFAQCGIARGNPFWSWPLLEWSTRLPAYVFHKNGRDKLLTRAAFRGRLPDAVLDAPRGGLLGPLFLGGLEERRDALRRLLFDAPRSDWQSYVHRAWLAPHLESTRAITFGHTILWRVICYELWVRRLAGELGDEWEGA